MCDCRTENQHKAAPDLAQMLCTKPGCNMLAMDIGRQGRTRDDEFSGSG
jgi:hypothetical protein